MTPEDIVKNWDTPRGVDVNDMVRVIKAYGDGRAESARKEGYGAGILKMESHQQAYDHLAIVKHYIDQCRKGIESECAEAIASYSEEWAKQDRVEFIDAIKAGKKRIDRMRASIPKERQQAVEDFKRECWQMAEDYWIQWVSDKQEMDRVNTALNRRVCHEINENFAFESLFEKFFGPRSETCDKVAAKDSDNTANDPQSDGDSCQNRTEKLSKEPNFKDMSQAEKDKHFQSGMATIYGSYNRTETDGELDETLIDFLSKAPGTFDRERALIEILTLLVCKTKQLEKWQAEQQRIADEIDGLIDDGLARDSELKNKSEDDSQ